MSHYVSRQPVLVLQAPSKLWGKLGSAAVLCCCWLLPLQPAAVLAAEPPVEAS